MCLLFLNFSNVRQDLTNQSKLYGNFCSDHFPFLSICCVPFRILTTLHLFCAVSLTWNQSKCKFRFILCVVISLLTDTFREFLIKNSYKLILHNTDMFFFTDSLVHLVQLNTQNSSELLRKAVNTWVYSLQCPHRTAVTILIFINAFPLVSYFICKQLG